MIRCALSNPLKTIINGCRDLYFYFKHKKYNEAEYGFIKCFVASVGYAFGAGKTLFGVHELIHLYRK